MTVILPQVPRSMHDTVRTHRFPTLYLLHGMSDNHTAWLRRTSIERYVAPLRLAVVMPDLHRSHCMDMASGSKYWTFLSEELPAIARSFFPLSEGRQDNFAAGLSSGGYGAFKLALTYPERYAAAASLSGVLDLVGSLEEPDEDESPHERRAIFGDPHAIAGSADDLFHLARRVATSGTVQPRLYQGCGIDDGQYEQNRRSRDYFLSLGLDLTYHEGPGEHGWTYWDQHIQHVLAWLDVERILL